MVFVLCGEEVDFKTKKNSCRTQKKSNV